MLIGYIRVSTKDQDFEAQRLILTEAGCEKIFSEKISGRVKTLPVLEEAFNYCRPGDTLCVTRVDRLARDTFGIPAFIKRLLDKDVHVNCISQNIDTQTIGGRVLITVFSAFAEAEHNLRRERINDARKAGRLTGRKKGLSHEAQTKAKKVGKMYQARNPDGSLSYSVTDIMKESGISRQTVYNYLEHEGIPKDREGLGQN